MIGIIVAVITFGTILLAGGTSYLIKTCGPGSIFKDGKCMTCPSDSYLSKDKCIKCDESSHSIQGSTKCISCDSGSVFNYSNGLCEKCPKNTMQMNNKCIPCNSCMTSNEGSSGCNIIPNCDPTCPEGAKFAPTGYTGTYIIIPETANCICDIGKIYSIHDNKCYSTCPGSSVFNTKGIPIDNEYKHCSCKIDQEWYKNDCVPRCLGGSSRTITSSTTDTPNCYCGENQTWLGFKCVDNCSDNKYWDANGLCKICPINSSVSGTGTATSIGPVLYKKYGTTDVEFHDLRCKCNNPDMNWVNDSCVYCENGASINGLGELSELTNCRCKNSNEVIISNECVTCPAGSSYYNKGPPTNINKCNCEINYTWNPYINRCVSSDVCPTGSSTNGIRDHIVTEGCFCNDDNPGGKIVYESGVCSICPDTSSINGETSINVPFLNKCKCPLGSVFNKNTYRCE
jgi:hypothetical protein